MNRNACHEAEALRVEFSRQIWSSMLGAIDGHHAN